MKTLGSLILAAGLAGCAAPSAASTQAQADGKYVANFNYTPPAQATPLSAKVTFAVAKPGYRPAGQLAWFTFPQFGGLDKALQDDLTEILTAKGFGVRGPYESYDLIPFQDKKDIDLWLGVTLAPTIEVKDVAEALENYWGWQSPTLQTGRCEVSGTLNVEMREIATKELMWTKTVPIKKFEFLFTVTIPWGVTYTPGRIHDFNPIITGMAKGMEQQYPDFMATVHGLIDAEEMSILRKQAQELKSKKGY